MKPGSNKNTDVFLNYSKETKELKKAIANGKQEIDQKIDKNKKELDLKITKATEEIHLLSIKTKEEINQTASIAKKILISSDAKDDKRKKWEFVISFIALIVSFISLFISFYGVSFAKDNAPLIIDYQVKKNRDAYDKKNHTVTLDFIKKQGSISRVYKAEFIDDEICYTQLTDFATNDNSFKVTIPLIESDEINDVGLREYFSANAPTSFALALLDYNNNLYIYYIVVRPAPQQKKALFKINTLMRGGTPIATGSADYDNHDKWEFGIALVDCSFPNDISIKNAILEKLNDNKESNGVFTYNEETGYFQSSFPVTSQDQVLVSEQGEEVHLNSALTIPHTKYNLEKDLRLIRSIPDDFIINSTTQDVRITG